MDQYLVVFSTEFVGSAGPGMNMVSGSSQIAEASAHFHFFLALCFAIGNNLHQYEHLQQAF